MFLLQIRLEFLFFQISFWSQWCERYIFYHLAILTHQMNKKHTTQWHKIKSKSYHSFPMYANGLHKRNARNTWICPPNNLYEVRHLICECRNLFPWLKGKCIQQKKRIEMCVNLCSQARQHCHKTFNCLSRIFMDLSSVCIWFDFLGIGEAAF